MIDYQKEINSYCKILKTPAIRKNYKEQISDKISFEEYIYNLLKLEYESREENAKQNKLRIANFPYKKHIEDLDMEALPEDGRKKLNSEYFKYTEEDGFDEALKYYQRILDSHDKKYSYKTIDEKLADEIQDLSERKQAILTAEPESQGEKERITEMMEFIENHTDQSLDYDEELVRLLVEKVTVFENNVVVRFKSGIEVEV